MQAMMFEAASALDKILEIIKERELSATQTIMFEAATALDNVILEITIQEQEERLRKESLARLEPKIPELCGEEPIATIEPKRPACQCALCAGNEQSQCIFS